MQNLRQKTIEDYDKISEQFSQTRQWLWPEFEFFKKYLKPNLKILDLGCGNGRLSELILKEKCEYLGIDNSEGQIREARKLFPELKFEVGDFLKIPLKDESVDQIWAIAAFHHLGSKKERLKALEEVKRVLKKDGLIIMTNWNLFQPKYKKYVRKAFWKFVLTLGLKNAWNDTFIPWKSGEKKIAERYYHAFTPRELEKLCEKSELKVVESFFTRKGEKLDFKESFNICSVVRKQSVLPLEKGETGGSKS